jgi:hypothetical protein
MRTTVTLDPDLAVRIQRLATERGVSFKAAINATIRAGLDASTPQPHAYQEVTRSLGVQPGVDLTKALQLAAALEDEATRYELDLRK